MSPTWDVGNTPRKRKNSAKSWKVGMSAVGFNAVDQQLYSTCVYLLTDSALLSSVFAC